MEGQFTRIVLIFWFISSFLVIFLLGQLDWLIHSELYNFGLEFDAAWAQPYWVTMNLIYVWLIGPSVLGAVALGFDFWNKNKNNKRGPRRKEKPSTSKVQPARNNSMVISCPSCKKVFTKPLVMLDFSRDKPGLVNVCPYCNVVLGKAEDNKTDDIRVGLDKEVVH